MKAEDWMTRDVRTCRPETSMNEAAHLMWARDCGVLPVLGADGRVVGMITDRDLCMGAYLQGKALANLTVADSMTRTVFSCLASDPIEEVIRRMGDEQVRRVPVLDARGQLVGVLSLSDLARRMLGLQDERQRARLGPRLMEALASISETRGAGLPELTPAARGAGRPLGVA
jgi:CBS domain-containing protein